MLCHRQTRSGNYKRKMKNPPCRLAGGSRVYEFL